MKLFKNGIIYTGEKIIHEFVVDGNEFKEVKDGQVYEEEIDLEGKFVLPGFNDSHMHLLNFGQALTQANLAIHTSSLEEMLNGLKAFKDTLPLKEGMWIRGRGWNQDYFEDENRFPTRYDLDQVSSEYPIKITRCCGHACVVNSKALELIHLPEDLHLDNGRIDVDENGVPLGIFREAAINFVDDVIPTVTKEEIKEMLLVAAKACNTYGITSCQSDDLKVFPVDYKVILEAYEEVKDQITIRVNEQAQLDEDELKDLFANGKTTNSGDDMFKIGPLKMLGDGSLGARTAYMKDPYADDPSTKGIPIFTLEQFKTMIELAHTHNMSVAIHSIGDQTFENILTAYEYVINKYPTTTQRHGIIHCQITSNEQIEKFAKLGLHAYVQSIFLDYDIHIVRDRVGAKADESYGFVSYLDRGCTLSNGSDCPVELPDVLKGMQCAITRTTAKDHIGPYRKEEAASIKQAIASFTSGSAYASFDEDRKGMIKEGMLADFVVLNQNLFEIDPYTIKDVKVLATYFNGKQVF